MLKEQEHVVSSYDEDLKAMDGELVTMAERSRDQVYAATSLLHRPDGDEKARVVISNDTEINDRERTVDRCAVRLLALRQPLATDLRHIVAAMKIASDFERIGDHAVNLAKRGLSIHQSPGRDRLPKEAFSAFDRLSLIAQEMMSMVVETYRDRDVLLAEKTIIMDESLDESYISLFRQYLTYMYENPRLVGACTQLLFMAKDIERIGDMATNVSEHVIYWIQGRMIENRSL